MTTETKAKKVRATADGRAHAMVWAVERRDAVLEEIGKDYEKDDPARALALKHLASLLASDARGKS